MSSKFNYILIFANELYILIFWTVGLSSQQEFGVQDDTIKTKLLSLVRATRTVMRRKYLAERSFHNIYIYTKNT